MWDPETLVVYSWGPVEGETKTQLICGLMIVLIWQ